MHLCKICVLLKNILSHCRDDMSSEKRLIRMLLQRYNRVGKQGRPVHDITTPTPVKFGLGLIQMDLDEKKKILALSAWTRYVSNDNLWLNSNRLRQIVCNKKRYAYHMRSKYISWLKKYIFTMHNDLYYAGRPLFIGSMYLNLHICMMIGWSNISFGWNYTIIYIQLWIPWFTQFNQYWPT